MPSSFFTLLFAALATLCDAAPLPLGGVAANPAAYALAVAKAHTPTAKLTGPALPRALSMDTGTYGYPPNLEAARKGAAAAEARDKVTRAAPKKGDSFGARSIPTARGLSDVHGYYASPERFDLPGEKKTHADYDRGSSSDL
ncbi:hypothetical protein K488DRAFT_86313 [Vararia minispora EC-137]|uniref:Uncharacterized protein n=1 Tax=Vararia minispora EC-137 TaxID=1314806 RepID=A0ACB8QJJ3_9AGAM|nr:hypothetical protein K488DRAFT_86313 [Vararia minispora EC-137]